MDMRFKPHLIDSLKQALLKATSLKALAPSTLIKNGLDTLLIPYCYACNASLNNNNYPYCDRCYAQLPFQQHNCTQCGQQLTQGQDYCGLCLTKPPEFDACFCPFEYQEPIRSQICAFKYNNKPELAQALAQTMALEISGNALDLPDLLIPVPMHISKLRSRGYNQASLIAIKLGQLLNIDVATNIIEKHLATPAQAELSLAQRRKNLKGSFQLKNKIPSKHVAIVDDVFTTGATAEEIAKILKQNGVDYCQVWGVAHTV